MKSESEIQLRRQAYMDDELPVEEVILFEETLNGQDKGQIDAEINFESLLIDQLKDGADCPDTVWSDLRDRLPRTPSAQREPVGIYRFRNAILAAAAALAVFGIVSKLMVERNHAPKLTVYFPHDLAEFARPASLRGDYGAITASLAEHNFVGEFKQQLPDAHHQIEFLGVNYHRIGAENIAQIFLSCCARPMTVFLYPKSIDSLADRVTVQSDSKQIHHSHSGAGNYKIHVIGPHVTQDIVNLFT